MVDAITSIRIDTPDYGYRRVTQELHNRGFNTNHKVVLKIMKMNRLPCTAYIDFYSGEILTWNIDFHPTVELSQSR
ncbi:transposase [Weissella confusa]|uniref:IS3 family transposase n=1 Tax=Weissella fermenti TaxID=2987699 RepID=A0ABT6D5U7_9LACO|nr:MULTISPECIES: IS3 family transposase [Weissella]MBJ7689264.1 transposase [Weissella confusa]MCW0927804.1 IS3 family transposase [Weissella sp. LMG 11983]MDF9300895.1 IS3 family transposase [Weissella sp. BK2]